MKGNKITSNDALKIAFKNRYKRWIPAVAKEIGDKANAMARFDDDFFFVSSEPSFTINKKHKIFTVGSCFARNVEQSLIANNVDVIGSDFSLASDILHGTVGAMNNKVNARSVLNKYSTLSICEEFDRVLNNKVIKDNGFISLDDELWIDPQLASVVKPLKFNELLTVREKVNDIIKQVIDADVVFVTLGLNEVWFDKHTGTYLNSSPPPSLMRAKEPRFEFSTPNFEIVYENLYKFVELVRTKSRKEVKFVVTVSPVPLSTTWTSSDIVVANSISKSTLRVCAERLTQDYDNVDYFPSFEMVTNSPKLNAWQSDKLHVAKPMVDFVIEKFMSTYFLD
ncbi:GSCFA domain-containing protein [Paraglaciecola chathamensis]|uniref:GSCFA domain-containing protein n=1 Tax=Paraglaciecola chathamensis TaxID=368405 RepID=UPI002706DCC5|nr:GSCFA domain-containing protein [Paraglaciecola chathamensis]MDO6838025.1 GSCFA domain-containing protein [Paraglaciecola chathamensis]